MRPDLPTGTVTFLFTDIEGSTRLLHELGAEQYAEVLAEHRNVLRDAFSAHDGVEVDTQGDGFLVAFPTASGALASAAEAQAALDGGRVRVRMGVHSGEPTLTEHGYVGLDVHLGARVMAAGHGGQVLVSAATHAAGEDGTPMRDLGEHRLKDIDVPMRLFQLGRGAFPPLKTLNNSNVPTPVVPLLGRAAELGRAVALLRSERARLVTVTGAGGSGKTRFAIEVARELIVDQPFGAWFVSLAAIRDPALVLPTAANVLGASVDLAEHVGDKRMLLVLDNFEQVVGAATAVADLLARCEYLQLLVTSREPLRITGEHELPLDPLDEEPAIELFHARARAIDPTFEAPRPTIAAIVGRVDRLPLGVELAAARVRALGADDLLARLDQRLAFLATRARDVPDRQRTLRATIEWSVDLLEPDERAIFLRLGVFPGSFAAEAAAAVAGASLDDLEALIERSLVRRWESGRFGMLETIRELAAELLERSGKDADIRRRHTEHYLAVSEAANLSVEAVREGADRHELVLPERHNVRAALDWAADADPELGLRLAVALETFWVTEDPGEGLRRLELLLGRAGGADPTLRARALRVLGGTAQMAGSNDVVRPAYEEGLAIARAAGDELLEATFIFRLGVAALFDNDLDRGRELQEDSLERFRSLGDTIGEIEALGNLGWIDFEQGERERGWERTRRSLEMSRAARWKWWEGGRLAELAERSLEESRTAEGQQYALEFLTIARETADGEATLTAVAQLAWAAAQRGDAALAVALWGAVAIEERLRPMARWESIRDRYAAEIPVHEPIDKPLSLDEAVEVVTGTS